MSWRAGIRVKRREHISAGVTRSQVSTAHAWRLVEWISACAARVATLRLVFRVHFQRVRKCGDFRAARRLVRVVLFSLG